MHSFWLVIGRCAMDDVPIQAFPTEMAAMDFAAGLTEDNVIDASRRNLGVDTSIVYGVDVLAFVRGIPDKLTAVLDFEDGTILGR